jgi:hypothetical protein
MSVEYLMSKRLQRLTDSLSRCLATIFNAVLGWTTVGLLNAIRLIPRRGNIIGTLIRNGFDAAIKLLRILEANRHVAMLVDQNFGRGRTVYRSYSSEREAE